MKVGDLVHWHGRPNHVCLVTEIYESKVWDTKRGKKVNWSLVEPEPFVKILVSNGNIIGVPMRHMELVYEQR